MKNILIAFRGETYARGPDAANREEFTKVASAMIPHAIVS